MMQRNKPFAARLKFVGDPMRYRPPLRVPGALKP